MSSIAVASIAPPSPARSAAFQDVPLETQPRYQPVVLVLAAVCAGMVADRLVAPMAPRSFEMWWGTASTAFIAWLACCRFGKYTAAAIAIFVCLAAIGGAWHHARWNLFGDNDLGRFATQSAQPICFEAIARTAPREIPAPVFDPLRTIPAGSQSRLSLDVVQVRNGLEWQPAVGRAQLSIAGESTGIRAGDRLRIFGQLAAPTPAANPGDFDFALFERGKRELSVVRAKLPACVSIVEDGSALNPTRWLDSIRSAGDRILWSYVSKDQAGLAAAVLLGEREEVDRETNDAFIQTGTVHILSVSGFHVGVLAWLLLVSLRSGWVRRTWALVGVMFITGAYMLLTMAEPPVIRATLLVWIMCGGIWLGRPRVGMNSLALAGLIVLVVNPANLFNIGVQLSFLSVAALFWLASQFASGKPVDPLERLIAATRPWPQKLVNRLRNHTWEMFLAGAALWFIITPLTMARFHVLPPIALVINVALFPVSILAMLSGFGVLLFGGWLAPLGAAFGWLCDLNLNALDSTVKWAATVPGGRFWVPGPGEIWLAVFYAAVVAAIALPVRLPPRRWCIALVGAWCSIGLLGNSIGQRDNHTLRCTFIAVGHGGAELLEFPDGKTLLYDAGRLGSPSAGAQSISNYLWSRGISHLDAVVVSHADTDHYNALPELLQRFSIGAIYVSPVMFRNESSAVKMLHDSIIQSGCKLEYLHAGDRMKAGQGVTVDVLHPPLKGVLGTDNANCVVLSVEYADRRILLTGDLEPPGMELVVNEPRTHYDVLLAPHHGSAKSEPAMFAAWSKPDFVVISGSSADGLLARPAYETSGATVLSTADFGAITVTVSVDRFDVQPYRAVGSTKRLSNEFEEIVE
jgi:competence protein ComEC